MSLVLSSPRLTPLLSRLIFLTSFGPRLILFPLYHHHHHHHPPPSPPPLHPPILHHYTRYPRPSPPFTSSPSVPAKPSSSAVSLSEPSTYRDAIAHPEWQFGMAEEIVALEHTDTWDLVPHPPTILITRKWVYKIKTRSDGSIECYKACLVARGFSSSMVVIMRRLLLLLLTGAPFILLLRWLLFVGGPSLNLT
jgi:hypothetical protein